MVDARSLHGVYGDRNGATTDVAILPKPFFLFISIVKYYQRFRSNLEQPLCPRGEYLNFTLYDFNCSIFVSGDRVL